MEPKEPNQGQMEEINLKPVPNAEVTFRKKIFYNFFVQNHQIINLKISLILNDIKMFSMRLEKGRVRVDVPWGVEPKNGLDRAISPSTLLYNPLLQNLYQQYFLSNRDEI